MYGRFPPGYPPNYQGMPPRFPYDARYGYSMLMKKKSYDFQDLRHSLMING